MHQRRALRQRLFGVEHEGQRFVIDLDGFRRVFRQRAAVGHHGDDPFAGIARGLEGERPARHVRRVEPGHQRMSGGGKLRAVEDVMHAGHPQCGAFVDRLDVRRGVRTSDHRDVLHIGQVDIGDELAFAGDEAAVLAHAAVGGDIAVVAGGAHLVRLRGRLTPRRRSAASAIASTICA